MAMIQSKRSYLQFLKKELKSGKQREDILREFDQLISEMLYDLTVVEGVHEAEAMTRIIKKIGSPAQVAQEFNITPTKTQWTFILANIIFFIGGIFLTTFYHLLPVPIVDQLWIALTSIPVVIMLLYMIFWALLGYEIGKEFGLGGKGLLLKTFYISLAPNLLLMGLVVFRIVPFEWFDPLLSPSFIGACIFCTVLLYPICYAGYRWGTIRSV